MTQLYNLVITINYDATEDELAFDAKDMDAVKSIVESTIGANQDATSFVFVIARR